MVFYKDDYNTVDEAMKYKDGLLVLALFYEVLSTSYRWVQVVLFV